MNRAAVFVLGALFLSGCYITANPGAVTNFLSGGDRRIADAVKRAAAAWAWHGLEIANYVTVDDGKAGIPVRFVPEAELKRVCTDNPPPKMTGCTYSEMGDWYGLLLRDDLADEPERLSQVVQHEIIHALVPKAPHLTGADGAFTASRTVDHITRADLEHLARYTEVTESQAPFFGEEA